jgi:hypothetical protein
MKIRKFFEKLWLIWQNSLICIRSQRSSGQSGRLLYANGLWFNYYRIFWTLLLEAKKFLSIKGIWGGKFTNIGRTTNLYPLSIWNSVVHFHVKPSPCAKDLFTSFESERRFFDRFFPTWIEQEHYKHLPKRKWLVRRRISASLNILYIYRTGI